MPLQPANAPVMHRKAAPCTLGLDLGTSGVRAVVLQNGTASASHSIAVAGEQRWDPGALWTAVVAVLRGLDLSGVRAVAIAGTSGTVLGVDGAGTALSALSPYHAPADRAAAAAVRDHAPPGSAAVGATSPLARAIALQRLPGLHRILHEADWIAGQLCGRFDMTDANNALKTGFDLEARAWPGWIAAAGMRLALLPHVVRPGTALGVASIAAAAATGLRANAIVAAGTTDGCASFLGTGADTPGDAVTALGSTLTLKLLSATPVTAPEFGIYSHRLPGLRQADDCRDRWLAGGASNAGGAVLARYFSPARLAELSRQIDPSQDSGLDYYPLLQPGERFPLNDPAMPPRLQPRPTDDAAFLHGLLEGLARIEALGYRRLAEHRAPALKRVLTVGGGGGNPTWTAIRARHLGVPVQFAPDASAALGAAMLARHALA